MTKLALYVKQIRSISERVDSVGVAEGVEIEPTDASSILPELESLADTRPG